MTFTWIPVGRPRPMINSVPGLIKNTVTRRISMTGTFSPPRKGDREMRVPVEMRRNDGHNIEMTDVTGCLRRYDLHYRFYIADIPVEVVDGFHPLSLVDFYNETALFDAVGRPSATINFPLFHDLAVGRRLMSTYTVFYARESRASTAAHRAFSIKGESLSSIKAGPIDTRGIRKHDLPVANQSRAVLKFR